MSAFLAQPASLWPVVTHLGSSSLMLPIFGIALAGLWYAGHVAAARIWLLALAVASGITLVSKCLFLGWGIGIAALNFTGVSGHTLLAASIFPVLCHWLFVPPSVGRYPGVVVGLLLAALIGVSRVVLGAHSVSEVVIAGWMGLVVSGLTVRALPHGARAPWFARLSPLVLLLALHTSTATYLPSHAWEVRLALYLSGHDRPFQRHDLL